MNNRARVIGCTLAGAVTGALIGGLLLFAVAAYMRGPVHWDDFPTGVPIRIAYVLIFVWTTYLGARFGYKVGTYEDPAEVRAQESRTWQGPGWSLTVAPGLVEVHTAEGGKAYAEDRLTGIFLVRTGRTWQLELPDGGLRVLAELDPADAAEITAALTRVQP